MPKRLVARITVRSVVGRRAEGRLTVGGAAFRCALGPAGIVSAKREGDGATPRGSLPVRRVFRRADRGPRPQCAVEVRVTRASDGWCDAVGNRRYNRLVRLPFPASHETMWRDDHLYDLVGELGWNDRPPTPGRGSAIFLHAARPDFTPTQGCVALAPGPLRRVLAMVGPGTRIAIGLVPRKIRRKCGRI
ncbi:L,D-transpeptidase family protein [Chelatococcus sambhunathii]|uniref:L,D-transpeptidase family protein n=1 Tax=Chelatococcus sambhunathii TaxID=363953 RepID=A0ABU1DH87_9HYPH|nr:L,D-transpeptidase family protein [Chelatococcus sambhunathii]MDR4307431.1 L,D-transpeptidase family protein [Chelatococcus sambhunathii]